MSRKPRLQPLPEGVRTEQVHVPLLLRDHVLQIQSQDLGESSQVEEVLSHLGFDRLPALLAERAGDVGLHRSDCILKGPVRRVGLLAHVHFDAATLGGRLGHRPLQPILGLLELGEEVEDAAVPDESLVDRMLEVGEVHGT